MLMKATRLAAAPALAAGVFVAATADHLQISESGYGAYEVSMSPWSDGLVVGWYDTRDDNAEIYLRQLDSSGDPAGPEYRITDDLEQSYEVDLAAAQDGLAVAWYDKDRDDLLRARVAFWDPADGLRWRKTLSAGGRAGRNPVVRVHDGSSIFVAWIEQDGSGAEAVWAGWWSSSGEALQAPVLLGPAGPTTWNLNAAIDASGVAYVVFDARIDTAADELYIARLEGRNAGLRRLTRDDGYSSKYPDLALSNGSAALTWFDERDGQREVYLYVGSTEGSTRPFERAARRVSRTPGASIGAYVAWNGERIGLVWSDASFGPYDVYFQPFDAAGAPIAAAERLTDTAESSLIPAIRAWRNGFAIAWNEIAPGPSGMYDPATRSEVHFTTVQ